MQEYSARLSFETKFGWTIKRVAYQRVAQRCQMRSNLVGAACFQAALDQAGDFKILQQLPMGYGFLAIRHDATLFAVCAVPPQGLVYRSLWLFGHAPAQGQVKPFAGFFFKLQ